MNRSTLSPSLLIPIAQILLMGSFAWTLLQAIRGKSDLALPFERLVIGMISISGFEIAAIQLSAICDMLAGLFADLHDKESLKTLLLETFDKVSKNSSAFSSIPMTIDAFIGQAWRTGIWGVMSAVVEGIFLIASFVLECAKEVLWSLLLILFPLGAGIFPVFPRMMTNLVLYAIELSLWFPMLCLVEIVTGSVARARMQNGEELGLYIVGVEVVAIVLILMIPSLTHRLMSGAFTGDFDSQASIFRWAQRALTKTVRFGKGGAK